MGTHAKFLHVALWIAFLISVYFALINSGLTALSFWALTISSLVGLVLNYIWKYILAAYIPVIMSTVALFVNFYEGSPCSTPGSWRCSSG